MTFPGPGAQIYYNEAGEPTGWDYYSDDPPDPDEFYEQDHEEVDEHLHTCPSCGDVYDCDCDTPGEEPGWRCTDCIEARGT